MLIPIHKPTVLRLAKAFDGKFELNTVNGSLLDLLVSVGEDPMVGRETFGQLWDRLNRNLASDEEGNETEHDQSVEEVVNLLSSSIMNHIRFARETVNPTIKTAFDSVNNIVKDTRSVRHSVEAWYPSALIDQPQVIDLAGMVGNVYSLELTIRGGAFANTVSDDKLLELIQTGAPVIDDAVLDFLASKPEGWLQQVWSYLFLNVTDRSTQNMFYTQPNPTNGKCRLIVSYRTLDYFLIGMLIARGLQHDTVSGSVSLQEYERVVSEYVQMFSAAVNFGRNMLSEYDSTGRLLLKRASQTPATDSEGVITVYGPSYDIFIHKGGAVEAIVGANLIADGQSYDTIDAINGVSEKLSNLYQYRERALEEADAESYWERLCRAGVKVLSTVTADLNETQFSGDRATIFAQIDKYFDTAKHYMPGDRPKAFDLVRNCLLDVVFAYTNARDILSLLDEVAMANGDMSVQEAAAYMVVELTVRYAMGQVQVTPISGAPVGE